MELKRILLFKRILLKGISISNKIHFYKNCIKNVLRKVLTIIIHLFEFLGDCEKRATKLSHSNVMCVCPYYDPLKTPLLSKTLDVFRGTPKVLG